MCVCVCALVPSMGDGSLILHRSLFDTRFKVNFAAFFGYIVRLCLDFVMLLDSLVLKLHLSTFVTRILS